VELDEAEVFRSVDLGVNNRRPVEPVGRVVYVRELTRVKQVVDLWTTTLQLPGPLVIAQQAVEVFADVGRYADPPAFRLRRPRL